MWNGLLAFAAFWLLVSNDVQASSSWALPDQASAYGLEADIATGGWTQPSMQSARWDFTQDQALAYPTTSAISLPAHTAPSPPRRSSAPVAAQRLTLEDLPVESEGSQQASRVEFGQERKQRSSLRAALTNLLRKPTLAKILVLVAVFAASFFLVGVLSRIAQLVISFWAALKALQLLEEHQRRKPLS
ncbi:hypothetical protein Emag_002425 [Eimeria magna]